MTVLRSIWSLVDRNPSRPGSRFPERQGQGLYRIEWRGLSIDGHAMRGRFTFRVK